LDEEPPLTIIAVLNLAWSLLLNISVNKKDIDIGKEVLKNWNEFQSRRIEKVNRTKDSIYLNNIFCLLFGFVESIAFERYFYYQYYDTQEKNEYKLLIIGTIWQIWHPFLRMAPY
jgi:hypothetical protein